MDYAIETLSLTKVFSDWWGRAKVFAVDDLNLKVQSNEVFGLLGPNGSGKTTTIKMLLGLLHPTKGHALVWGGDSTNPKINKRIGFLPEESYLYRFLNARETLDFYGQLFGLEPKIRQMRIEALLEMVGLTAVASRPVGTYSKGMARRIGLAQALINDPDLLILDEPTTGLDPIGTRQIKDLIIKLAERGKTILLCSHLLGDVEDVCNRIAILYGGKVQAEGQVKDLLQKTNKRQIVTDAISDGTVDRIKSLLAAEHAQCEISSPMERLEAFFIHTVAEAQRQARPTSGAVSTTQIGDFLQGEKTTDAVLNKLVSASVSPDKPAETPKKGKKAAAVETAKPDKSVLDSLTRPGNVTLGNSGTSQTAKTAKEVETPRVEEGVKKDVLDALLGRSGDSRTTPAPKPPQTGKDGHA
jgi:ABC-2 type transport system ATP-binding protein